MADETFRLRVAYRKDGRLAYLGHLEVINTVERSIRRSGLPFSVGNGFAHRMRVQFSQALPVGAFSEGEYYDLILTEEIDPREALELLQPATPPALGPYRAAYVPRRFQALEAWLDRSQWQVEIHGEGLRAEDVDAGIGLVKEAGKIDFMRGDKPRTIETVTTLVSWDAQQTSWGVALSLETHSSNLGALRPAVLLDAAFGTEPLAGMRRSSQRVCRTGQWHEENGRLVEPFDANFTWSLT